MPRKYLSFLSPAPVIYSFHSVFTWVWGCGHFTPWMFNTISIVLSRRSALVTGPDSPVCCSRWVRLSHCWLWSPLLLRTALADSPGRARLGALLSHHPYLWVPAQDIALPVCLTRLFSSFLHAMSSPTVFPKVTEFSLAQWNLFNQVSVTENHFLLEALTVPKWILRSDQCELFKRRQCCWHCQNKFT